MNILKIESMAAAKGNKYAVGANNGRPPKYKTLWQLTVRCDEYFKHIEGESHQEKQTIKDPKTNAQKEIDIEVWDRQPEPPTITGLTLFLGFADKSSLYDYRDKQVFSHPIKRAITLIEHHHEKGLANKNSTGHIFALKNRGWSDKIEVESTTQSTVNITNQEDIITTPEDEISDTLE